MQWLFDLDGTLHQDQYGVAKGISESMTRYIEDYFSCSRFQADAFADPLCYSILVLMPVNRTLQPLEAKAHLTSEWYVKNLLPEKKVLRQ